jgi:putative hydrolase of the HAD superfamily
VIFFDLDGTLLDFKGSERLGVNAFYKEYGYKVNVNEDLFYEHWSCIGQHYFKRYLNGELSFEQQKIERVKEVFSLGGISLNDNEAIGYFKRYLKCFEDSWQPFDDVIPCLQRLSGQKLGIITNGDYDQQLFKLKKIKPNHFFDVVVTSGELGISKPDQRIFEFACEKAGKNPHECYYIGDDLHTDILACQKVNMNGLWLDRAKSKKHIDGISVIHSLGELNNLFFSL